MKSTDFFLQFGDGDIALVDFSPNGVLRWLVLVLLLLIFAFLHIVFLDFQAQSADLLDEVDILLHDADILMFVYVRVFLQVFLQHADGFLKILLLVAVLVLYLRVHLGLCHALRHKTNL